MAKTKLNSSCIKQLLLGALSVYLVSACQQTQLGATNCQNDYARLSFDQIDVDHNQQISQEEFEGIYHKLNITGIDYNSLRANFKLFDQSSIKASASNGQIERHEFLEKAQPETQKYTFTLGGCSGRDLSASFCCQFDTSHWTGSVFVNSKEARYDIEELASNPDIPIAKVQITLGKQTYETNDKGQFSIPKAALQEETITFAHPGYLTYQTTIQKSLNAFEIYLSKYSPEESLSEKREPQAVYGISAPELPAFFISDATKKLYYAVFKEPGELEPLWRFIAAESMSRLYQAEAKDQALSASADEIKKTLEAGLKTDLMLIAVASQNRGPFGIPSPINSIFENSNSLIFSNHYSTMKVIDPLSEKPSTDALNYTIQLFAIKKTDKKIQFNVRQ